MNCLQKIEELLKDKDFKVTYGIPREIAENTVVALSIGNSDDAICSAGDCRIQDCIIVNLHVYSSDYNEGLDTILEIKNEMESAEKSTMFIFFLKLLGSDYNERLQRYVLKSQYKIVG